MSGVPEVRPASGETAPEKRSPGTAFPPGWEMQFTGGKASEPPAGKMRPSSPWRSRLPECVRPEYPVLSSAQSCMFLQTRTQAYLQKGLGADFHKLSRATAMRPVSRHGKPLWVDSEAGALPQSISTPRRESGSLCPILGCVDSHTVVSPREPRMFLRDEVH